MRSIVLVTAVALATPIPAGAQEWNSENVRSLVVAATVRRNALLGTRGLNDYSARAHGFVFFMAQVGEGFPDPPRVVKADQLELQVYWKSPNLSKQRIRGWRDRIELPTEIRYHRDHLGIVQNNFGDSIRLGDGTEARDVMHPLAAAGPTVYDYAIVDSLAIATPNRTVRVVEVRVRPRSMDSPAVFGSLFLETTDASVVRFRFSFTSSAYLDDDLEDITILLENGLSEGEYWLPRRQEIEIRRRSSTFGIPIRGIIRGRWELDGYRLNVGLPDSLFVGQEIVADPPDVRSEYPWQGDLDDALLAAESGGLIVDLDEVRTELGRTAGGFLPTGLPASQFGVASLSDLIRFNRVEGLSVGMGRNFGTGGGPHRVEVAGRYALADRGFQGRLTWRYNAGGVRFALTAASQIEDMGEAPVVSGVLGSLLAQEAGRDLGDYLRRTRFGLSAVPGGVPLTVSVGVERAFGLSVKTTPVSGTFRANPFMAGPWWVVARAAVALDSRAYGARREFSLRLATEGGTSNRGRYARVRTTWYLRGGTGLTETRFSGWAGLATRNTPAHRTFVLGGWGTLPGEDFRRWGGRTAAFGKLEFGVRLPLGSLPLGGLVAAGSGIYAGPFLAAGWTDRPPAGFAWQATGKPRVVLGLALEPFGGLIRIEVARNLTEKRFGVTFDVTRRFWGVL